MKLVIILSIFVASLLLRISSIRDNDRKDKEMDLEMANRLLKMYFCSGDENWTDKITRKGNRNFVLSQFITFQRMMFCSHDFDFQHIKEKIDVRKYKSWFESTGDNRETIRSCMDESAKHLLKLGVCCKEFSKQILDFVHNLFCSDKIDDEYSTMCWILTITNRDVMKRLLFKIIEKSNICDNRCPLDHNKKSNTEQNYSRKNKRQFDLASTFATIGQFMCEDVLEGSTQDGLHFLFKELDVRNGDDNPEEHKYLRYMLLMRRPVCCLLQNKLHG